MSLRSSVSEGKGKPMARRLDRLRSKAELRDAVEDSVPDPVEFIDMEWWDDGDPEDFEIDSDGVCHPDLDPEKPSCFSGYFVDPWPYDDSEPYPVLGVDPFHEADAKF